MLKHKTKVKIGVDLLGNENTPEGLAKILHKFCLDEKVHLILIGNQDAFSSLEPLENCEFIEAKETIEMEDNPLTAIRRKKQSSMHVGIDLLKDQKIDAFISLGNTGTLVGLACMQLPVLDQVSRPALLSLLPTQKNPVAILDIGAHIDSKTENFLDFAKLGNAYQKSRGIKSPTIGLLNIGTEKLKGTNRVKQIFGYLEDQKNLFNFVGNVEGKEVFTGNIDVILTDGFTGNVFLKTSEGVASMILDELSQKECDKTFFQDLKKRLHYAQYPGAFLIGLDALVIKCHGYSTPQAVVNAVKGAKELVQNQFIANLKKELV